MNIEIWSWRLCWKCVRFYANGFLSFWQMTINRRKTHWLTSLCNIALTYVETIRYIIAVLIPLSYSTSDNEPSLWLHYKNMLWKWHFDPSIIQRTKYKCLCYEYICLHLNIFTCFEIFVVTKMIFWRVIMGIIFLVYHMKADK